MRTQPVGLLLPLLLAACSTVGLPSSPTPSSAATPVTFVVKAPPAAFSDKGTLKLTVWDAQQLAIAAKTADCTVSMDVATGKETTTCPAGVTYQKATPEEVVVTKAQLQAGFTFTSMAVTSGERYRVAVSGKASDDCNSASGSAEGVAGGTELNIEIKDVAQTMMACIPADQMPGAGGDVTFSVNVDATKFSNKKQITVTVTDAEGKAEETIVSHADLDKPLTITSKNVQAGEKYDVNVAGMAADGCNSASASAQGTAVLAKVGITFEGYAQTKMACLPVK